MIFAYRTISEFLAGGKKRIQIFKCLGTILLRSDRIWIRKLSAVSHVKLKVVGLGRQSWLFK